MDNIMSRFLILQDPADGTWVVIHESGILVSDCHPTYEDAFVEMVWIGSKVV